MLRAVLLVSLAACSFSKSIDGDDAPGESVTLTDENLAGTAQDAVVLGGTVQPDGFVLGGLHARGFQAKLVDNGEDIAKILLDAAGATQVGESYAQVPADWVTPTRPKGLGLISNDNFTVIYDGEILLPKGAVTLEASVDDRGVVELLGQRIANTGTTTLAVAEAGWYPIRAAMTQDGGSRRFVLTIVQDQVRTLVDADRLRARVTDQRGLVVFAFDGEHFDGARGQTARPTIAETFPVAPAYDLTAEIDQFSLRFAGQLRIDSAGAYVFDANVGTDESWRLWIDGAPIAHRWPGHTTVGTGTVDLAAGWHTILVDYQEGFGGGEITVRMAGPDAPGGGPIDPAHLRPVVVLGNTYTSEPRATQLIADNASTFVPLILPGDATEVIDAVDYGFRVDAQVMATLDVTLFDCTAGRPLVTGTLPATFTYAADKTCAGKVTNPLVDWTLLFFDKVADLSVGSVRDAWVSALYHGGPKMPFAPLFTYTSEPKATPGATRIEAARAIGMLDGATIEIAVRAADDPDLLAMQPYEVVRDGVPVETAGAYLQYRVTISTNGWISPVLAKVEIDYIAQ